MAEAILRDYLNKIGEYYQRGDVTEHSYRGSLQILLERLETGVRAINEPKRIACGAPDYVVERERDHLTIGYVEAKDVGVSLDKIEKDEQLKRYLRALDNLILTDYLEFRWYVRGERQMSARIGSIRNKKIILDKDGVKLGEELLNLFLKHKGEKISKPQELAQRMARLTYMIRDIIVDAFREKEVSDNIQDLYAAFQELLLPDLKEDAFADMFAQTIAYGLFAARYNHKDNKPFTRSDAAKEIPRTNPFLRRFFSAIAGSDLDDEPFVGFVDELAQVLAFTDMDAVLADFGKSTRQEDPIVHFYETFLSQYDPELRVQRGVYYTPAPVVSYIVRSVDYLLREHFDCNDGLADTATVTYSYTDADGKKQVVKTPRVMILDPATGTGTFLYNVIDHIRGSYRQMGNAGMWSGYVREHLLPRLFGFELLMAPYAMAHLKLGMQLGALDLPEAERKTWAYDFASKERLGIYLTNTLDEARKRSDVLFGKYISDEANEAAKVKQGYPVMVVLGNPPYSGYSANKGKWISSLQRGIDLLTGQRTGNYFEVDGQPLRERNPKALRDDYVKFIRFAQWRIEQTGYGILAFITNHSYIDNPTTRGMRQNLMQSFDDIYILDLHGNSKKKEVSPDGSKDENVFDIQQGVSISIFVKRRRKTNASRTAVVRHADLWGPREVHEKARKELVGGKYHWLSEHDIQTTKWTIIEPQAPYYLFRPLDANDANLEAEYNPPSEDIEVEYKQAWAVNAIFTSSANGFKTHRDHVAVAFDAKELRSRIEQLIDTREDTAQLAEQFHLSDTKEWKLSEARSELRKLKNWEENLIPCLYRPMDPRFCYYSPYLMDRPREAELRHVRFPNICFATGRQGQVVGGTSWNLATVGREVADTNLFYRGGIQYFPLYLYPDPKQKSLFDFESPSNVPGGRRPNLARAFIEDFSKRINLPFISDGRGDLQQNIGPEDIFNYLYAFFHAPTYRDRYSSFLKIDFPRLPLTSNVSLFRELCKLGDQLVGLHLLERYGKVTTRYPVNGNNVVHKVNYTYEPKEPDNGRVWINKEQYFEGIPLEVWEFHIGGYQVCQKWLKDRKERQLTHSDLQHYQRIVAVLAETITLMEQIDDVIDEHGGWPIQ